MVKSAGPSSRSGNYNKGGRGGCHQETASASVKTPAATTPEAAAPAPSTPTRGTATAWQSYTSTMGKVSPARSDAPASQMTTTPNSPQPATPPNPEPPTHEMAAASIGALDETTVLANRFIPASLKALNQAPTSYTLVAGRIPTLAAQIERLYEDIIPRGIECACEGVVATSDGTKKKRPHAYDQGSMVTMMVRKMREELRYALFSYEPLSKVLETGITKKRKGVATYSPYAGIISTKRTRTLIEIETKDLEDASAYHDKYEGLLIFERDEILRLYEHLSQYRVQVQVSPSGGRSGGSAASTFLFARIVMPGIADVQPSLSVGDICLVRPVEPLQLMAHLQVPSQWQGGKMMFDQSRQAYVPNPVEIQCLVLRIVRGRGGNSDEVVITWLSAEDDSVLQRSWLRYPPERHLYNVRFVPDARPMERCLTALDWAARLPDSVVDSLILARKEEAQLALPKYKDGHKHSEAADGKCIDIGQYSLNEKQHAFVSMCISRAIHPSFNCIREPMLLTGPAGVGKTRTLYAAINQILDLNPKNRILVCAPSHTAANVLTQRLAENLSEKDLFRLVDSDRGSDTIPFAVLRFTRYDQSGGAFTLPPKEELLQFRVIICTCLDAHILYSAGLTNATLRGWRKCLSHSAQKLFKKCQLSFDIIRGVDEPHFTHLFIDEAAQATESESLIPLSVVVDPEPGAVKVEIALVGDPRQLGAQVYSSVAAKCGLGFSFLERLLQRPNTQAIAELEEKQGGAPIDNMEDLLSYYNEDKEQTSVFLNVNYRCRPEFLMMPSALFYFDKLQSAKSKGIKDPEVMSRWCRELRMLEKMRPRVEMDEEEAGDVSAGIPRIYRPHKQDMWPVHFRGVEGRDTSVALDSFPGTNSWSNLDEAKEVSEIVLALARDGVKPQQIGVMAPFRGQVVQIRRLLRDVSLGQVNVGTIEDYQAVEYDVIVLSLTRSTTKFVEFDIKRRAGVFGQPKRSNVALTRPEHLLVIVGNPNVMVNCSIWRQILWFFLRNGLWHGESGSKGCAGLELTDELVYSTTGTGDVCDETMITVGTLEKISRQTEAFDKDSIEAIIAKGAFAGAGGDGKIETKTQAGGLPSSNGTTGPDTGPAAQPNPALLTKNDASDTGQSHGNIQQPIPYPYPRPVFGPPGLVPMDRGMAPPPPHPGVMHPGQVHPSMMGHEGDSVPPPPGHPDYTYGPQSPYPFGPMGVSPLGMMGPGPAGMPPPGMMMGPGGPMPSPGYMQYGQGPMSYQPPRGAQKKGSKRNTNQRKTKNKAPKKSSNINANQPNG